MKITFGFASCFQVDRNGSRGVAPQPGAQPGAQVGPRGSAGWGDGRRAASVEYLLGGCPHGCSQAGCSQAGRGGAAVGVESFQQRTSSVPAPVPAPRTFPVPRKQQQDQLGLEAQQARLGARGGARGGARRHDELPPAPVCQRPLGREELCGAPRQDGKQEARQDGRQDARQDARRRVLRYVGGPGTSGDRASQQHGQLGGPGRHGGQGGQLGQGGLAGVRSLEDIDLLASVARAVPDLVPGLRRDLDSYRVYTEAVRRLRADTAHAKPAGRGSVSDHCSSDFLLSCESEIGEEAYEEDAAAEESAGPSTFCETAGDSGVESTHSMQSYR